MSKISIVIPVFNAGRYLCDCIASLHCQTLRDVEFIFVDDASTDDGPDIIAGFAKKDKRVVFIQLPENVGSFMARKIGVEKVNSPYVTFLDPDDSLLPDACRLFVEKLDGTSADIVHGAMIVENKGNVPQKQIDAIIRMTTPKFKKLEGREILRELTAGGNVNPSLIGKAYRTDLVKRANDMISNGRYRRAQDYLVNFVVGCMAEKYVSIPENAYRYGYGNGFFGAVKHDISHYATLCSQVDILKPLRETVSQFFSADTKVGEALCSVEKKLVNGAYSRIFTLLDSMDDRKKAFAMLKEKMESVRFLEILAETNHARRSPFAIELASVSAVPKNTVRHVRTIGIFYHHMTFGGIQRVISTLIPVYKRLGLAVVLFLEKKIDDDCYDIPEYVSIEYLNTTKDRVGIAGRIRALHEGIGRHGVDMLYHHAFLSQFLIWDLLVCKWCCDIPVIVHVHTATCYRPFSDKESYQIWFGENKILSFADGVIALSKADQLMLRSCGARAKYIPNPTGLQQLNNGRKAKREGNEILWVGRLSREKNPSDPIAILAKVKESIPDAKLTIIGGGSDAIVREMEAVIEKCGLQDDVTLVGGVADVCQYYKKASVFLHTSDLEGYPVALLEACAFELPIVMYSLPWLEIVRGNDGIVSVAQSDIKAAASEVVSILTSSGRWSAMSKANKIIFKELCTYDHEKEWASIFRDVEVGRLFESVQMEAGEDVVALVEQFIHCYTRGVMTEKSRARTAHHTEQVVEVWLFRKVIGGVKCLRENGLWYTVRHIIGKILRRLGLR